MIIARENTENGEVILRQGPAGYEIIVDGQFLMSSASGNSSVALVELGLAKLAPRRDLKVLIGGLGLGFSLKTALADPAVAGATVIELENRIIEWHRRGLIGETVRFLNDRRTKVINRDFLQFMAESRAKYDLIALDIDNGPDWVCHETNARLYGGNCLQRLREMLYPEGVLTMWSAAPSPHLKWSLETVFGNAEEAEAADHNGEGKVIMAYIYICRLEK
jgi:Spermidine synthase